MFGDYSLGDLGSIFVMQGFAGLILFSVYVLMALGLAIIFGQMGVINMAHGEFMILGAYVTWMTSSFFQSYLPSLFSGYFFLAMILAFVASGALGMLVEWVLIRHLYKRPLDTLLATWGLSLILQQAYRSVFGAREVGVELPQWMLGSLHVTDSIEVPINGVFVMCLTVLITVGVAYVMYKSRWGRQVRAVVQNRIMAGAVGINTEKGGSLHFRPRLRHCRCRWERLHHDRLDRADLRTALHRRYVPGGRVRRRGKPARHHRIGLLNLADPIHPRVLPVGLDG
ncbi:urea ABC transporter permease protein UrtB [Bradyrhizobium sp. GM7.3]